MESLWAVIGSVQLRHGQSGYSQITFERFKKVGETLGKVYKAKRRLC